MEGEVNKDPKYCDISCHCSPIVEAFEAILKKTSEISSETARMGDLRLGV